MLKKKQILLLILILGVILATYSAIGQEEGVTDDIEAGAKSFWDRIKLPVLAAALMFVFQGIIYIINLFKKDRLLKTLMNKYVVFDMKSGHRYQGTMRFGNKGMEIVSEESRQRGQAPSYIFPGNELQNNIRGYIRYIDMMNEREQRERAWELERLLNPPLSQRMIRKFRNIFFALNEAVKNAINMVWGGIRQAANPLKQQMARFETAAKEFEGQSGTQAMTKAMDDIESTTTKAFLKEESYDTIVERLVGTRVKIKVEGSGEYMALLKDYNKEHMAFMNLKDNHNNGYKDQWNCDHEYKHNINNFNRRDDRGLRSRMVEEDGKYFIVFENNTAYTIQVGKITLHDGSPNWERNLEFKWHIEPLSVRRIRLNPVSQHKVAPFDRVSIPEHRTPRNFKKIRIEFRSFRDADVIFPRSVCRITESAEKQQQQELFSISALTDDILERSESEEIAIQDAKGKPIHGMNLVHGYVTNVNEERIDLKTVDSNYSRRWEVESAYTHFDNSLRHRVPIYRRLIPFFANRLVAQNALIDQMRENPLQQDALSQLAYPKSVKKRLRLPLIKLLPSKNGFRLPLKVMALTGNATNEEFPILERFEYVHQHRMLYESVDNLRNDRLAKMDILWIGNGEIYKSGYRLNIDSEHRIKNFVSQGGVVIVSGQDIKTNVRQRRGGGWIPEPLTGIEYDETDELLPTAKGRRSRVFHIPNMLNSTPDTKEIPLVRLDDMWVDPLGKWNSLAKSTAQDASAILTLPFQQGLYIVTSLKNDTEKDAEINNKLMENLLHFSVKWLDNQKWKQRFSLR